MSEAATGRLRAAGFATLLLAAGGRRGVWRHAPVRRRAGIGLPRDCHPAAVRCPGRRHRPVIHGRLRLALWWPSSPRATSCRGILTTSTIRCTNTGCRTCSIRSTTAFDRGSISTNCRCHALARRRAARHPAVPQHRRDLALELQRDADRWPSAHPLVSAPSRGRVSAGIPWRHGRGPPHSPARPGGVRRGRPVARAEHAREFVCWPQVMAIAAVYEARERAGDGASLRRPIAG